MTPRVLATLALVHLLAPPSLAVSIDASAFGAGAVVEGFEGITTADPNVAAAPWAGIMEPGATGDFAFASGLVLSGPNPGAEVNGAFVHDLSIPGATNNWGAHGSVNSPARVPFDTAYLGAFDNVGSFGDPVAVEFRVTSDLLRVGAYVSGGLDGGVPLTVTLDVYGEADDLLESRSVSTVPVADWGTNFLGIERSEGIRRFVFSGADFGIDALTFETPPTAPVPEPSSDLLLAAGLMGLAMAGRPRPRNAR